ncbi:MAG: DinB family protein [Chitinophagales bacterium]|nr:DinB family protein [Chitinophagales bacterium]
MSIVKSLISEIKHEAEGTRKMLSLVKEEHFDFKPHEKSMSMKSLAAHIAVLCGWPGFIATSTALDLASNDVPRPSINSTEDLVAAFDGAMQDSLAKLENVSDADLNAMWALKHGDHVIMEMPRGAFIRFMGMNHMIHHRAQLGVYLRLLNIPIPGMYGPSADDRP